MSLSGKRIVLGVTGSIAAYKAADIASKLVGQGADVYTVLTDNAEQFVGAATFRALTGNPVLSGVFDEPFDRQIAHIELAQESDLILVAPASANILAKMAHGMADDLLSTILLAATAPILVAPAMNEQMLRHAATQANLSELKRRGVGVIDPQYGVLACRTEGFGKLADTEVILKAVVDRLTRSQDVEGRRVLVTAGATREPIDPVRFISNRSSGRMGFAIAEAARDRGAIVTVIAGHTSIEAPSRVEVVRVGTTEEMLDAACARFPACDLFIAAAAPADYAPVEASGSKIKKSAAGRELSLSLKETPDVLATVAAGKKKGQIVVGFAAETENTVANATEKLARKRLDLIVANDVTVEGAGFEVETNVVTIVYANGRADRLDLMTKREAAEKILDAALALHSPPKSK
jgi:phosphopantothenoylcysteine decarboxylase/phosphopantothenate--cysteine ligase